MEIPSSKNQRQKYKLSPWVVGAAAICLIAATLQAGLIANPDFKEIVDGKTAGWSLEDGQAIPAEGTVLSKRGVPVSVGGDEGKRCVKMEGHGLADGNGDYALVGSTPFELRPGCEYEISFSHKASGLLPETGDRSKYAALVMDLFHLSSDRKFLASTRIITYNNSASWSVLSKKFITPSETKKSQVRFQLVNLFPGNDVTIRCADISIKPVDIALPNPSFEMGESAPTGWSVFGSAKMAWVDSAAHAGKRSVSVSDAPAGQFSGWSTAIPVRADRTYAFGGYVKGGNLAAAGFVGGGAFSIQFLDAQGQSIGDQIISAAVSANTEWIKVMTRKAQPPDGAISARLVAGLQYCSGTAWFDDVDLSIEEAELKTAAKVVRTPQPSSSVRYAKNLLKNGDVEELVDGKPAGWTYVGKSEPDWSKDEIDRFHTNGRPEFAIGRGRGELSTGTVYDGKGALLNISISPPISPKSQWYGRFPIDGYWLSGSMPCEPGKGYLASCWLRPGTIIGEAWHGPLEIRFYDKNGGQAAPKNYVRCGLGDRPSGVWTYWVSMPSVAPDNTVSMRLRFGQELKADAGGWGRTYGDNFAVWALSDSADIPTAEEYVGRTDAFLDWFIRTHSQVKPPYLPSPSEAVGYESCLGSLENATLGNLFHDPDAPTALTLRINNLLGEDREVSLRVTRMNWLGDADEPFILKNIKLTGFGESKATVNLPPTKKYGAFYLDAEILEGEAVMGKFSGRYAEMPPLERPRAAERIWGVTPLSPLYGDGRPFEREMGEMMRIAGFGIAWVRIHIPSMDPAKLAETFQKTKNVVLWYKELGIRPVLQIMPGHDERPVGKEKYLELGKRIGTEFKGLVAAYGNHCIEEANSTSPYRSGGKDRLRDEEYDTVMAGIYDGIKSVDKETPVLIGNISTDWEGVTVRRLYGKPGEGKFDGAILNAYLGILMTAQNNLKEFDSHGDNGKTVWQEETADQTSPSCGEARRYGEADGPRNMVRTWLSMAGIIGPRLKAMTMWGFVAGMGGQSDIPMLTATLQPRPQFVAHAVMADALADAAFVANCSKGDVSIFEWKRSDGLFFALWANSGERSVTFEVSRGELTIMDLMGNCGILKATDGLVCMKLTTTPVYLFGGGEMKVSKRIEATLGHGDTNAGRPQIRLTLRNNDKSAFDGKVTFVGPIEGGTIQSFSLKPGETTQFEVPVKADLPTVKRSTFTAECVTSTGAVFTATSSLNFLQAVKAVTTPALDGTWKGWEAAPVIAFGDDSTQIVHPSSMPDEKYTGKDDLLGKLRLMWDEKALYLGVEALDDVSVFQPERGSSGFMTDSIEFAFQPENIMAQESPRWEFELYLPDGKPPYAATRRFPLPAEMISSWKASVTPTGTRGNVNYQVAIPWKDIVEKPQQTGKTIYIALVLNETDLKCRKIGGRGRILFFQGIDIGKNPEGFGDVTLVEP